MKYIIFLLVCLFFEVSAYAQISTFSTTINDEEDNTDVAYNIRRTKDKGFILTSLSYCKLEGAGCVVVVKTDSLGQLTWRKTYTNSYAIEISNYQSLSLTEDDKIVLSGSIYELEDEYDMFIFMLDSNGDSLWMQQYGGSQRDLARGVIATPDGGYILTGLTTSFAQNERADVYLIKTDSLGNEEWSKTYGDVYGDMGISIEPDTDGGYVLGAYFESNSENTNRLGMIIKTDSLGEVLWQKQYGSIEKPHGPCLIQPSKFGGYFYVSSGDTIIQEGYFNQPRYIARLDSQGNTLWETYISLGAKKTAVGRIVELKDGSFIFCGFDENTGFDPLDFDPFGLIGKLSADGELLWLRKYAYLETVSPNMLIDIIPTEDGGFIASGVAVDTIGGVNNPNIWLLKVDDRGCLEPGCEDDVIITDIKSVGEENIADGSRMLLYPNPATEQTAVYFKKQLATNAVLEVYDVLGRWRQRYDLRAFQERQVLDLEGLELGAYLCVLKVEGKVVDKVRFLNKNS